MFSLPKTSIPILDEGENIDSPRTPERATETIVSPPKAPKRSSSESFDVSLVEDSEGTDHADKEAPPPHPEASTVVEVSLDSVNEAEDEEEGIENESSEKQAAESLERKKSLKELRQMCSAEGLPTTGTKSDLARRLTMTAM